LAQQEIRYARNPDYIYRKIVEEVVLVPIRQDVAEMDCIYTLNTVGAFIWERLASPATRAELEGALLEEYDVGPEVAAADLQEFLREMTEIGAVHEV